MLIGFADVATRDAAHPRDISSGEDALAMTLICRSPNMAYLLPIASLKLTRLSDGPSSDYHLGSDAGGVTFRPADRLGNPIATEHTKESLMHVSAVTLIKIGVALQRGKTA